jgi:aryl carrier-like protein
MRVGEERAEHMERDILAVFREQLDDPDMGPADDYFERGGDSLSALLVVGELLSAVGVDVGVGDLFGHPSARGLARYLALQAAGTPDSPPSSEDRREPECDPRLVELTRTVLGVALGPDDDFFTAGGDSQAAVRLVSLARAAGLDLGVGQVIELRTPRQLSKVLNPQSP